MSGEPSHPTDCSEVLDRLYEYLDRELPDGDSAKFREHIEDCGGCLEKYGLEESVKKLVKRCCGHDEVPGDLREKVLGRIERLRCGEEAPAASAEPPGPAA
ncbi:mycothiol system anti-sigma-R factor [Streptomyces sp. RFCAC02]|uniref:mycothiol system anti-sigma-R factor n=1 Tax=Streptomyces sp. RFCAC02 TaxID=2499143 RepID=UPI00102139A2|nr:mycothiol system anti-sigma-R factor [Streptomyces sp. RFCAC02]